jgi:hypothetical protein
MGVKRGYICDRCPLAFEIGGYHYWDLDSHCEQAVCRGCGTMHRLVEKQRICQVLALPGPIRSLPLVTYRTAFGDETQVYAWPFTEADWQPVGIHPGGIEALGQLACSRCDQIGRMQSLELPRHPDGNWVSFREICPLCGGPMPFLYDDTVN